MDRLPSEILLEIFRRINDFRVKLKLELVCRQWRQLMRGHGWKHVRRVVCGLNGYMHARRLTKFTPDRVVPIGEHCGNNLVECSFYRVTIDSNLMRLIAANFHALRHLKFHSCKLQGLDENALDPFLEFCARLRSLSFAMEYHPQLSNNLLRHFPRLRHLGLNIPFSPRNFANEISGHFSPHLRSLYLNCIAAHSSDQEQMLANVQTASPGLKALFLNFLTITELMLFRISEMKNLRCLQMRFFDNSDLFYSCLANLPHLRALQISFNINIQQFLCRSLPFRHLVHLSLFLLVEPSDNFESIGLLSKIAPKLRSLSLNSINGTPWKLLNEIGCQLLKTVHNSNLEHLNLPCASFTIAGIEKLIRLCPSLHSIISRTSSIWEPRSSEIADLLRVVADQWRAGTRKHVPLQIWILEKHDPVISSSAVWQDPFLTVRHVYARFTPPNPVLDQLFREEVFNGNDDGGTPSFITDYFDDRCGYRVSIINDLLIL